MKYARISGLLLSSALVSAAKEQHIRYTTETEIYDISFDDQRISMSSMQRLVWLSPNLPPDLPGPFLMLSSYQQDKRFRVPAVEDCRRTGKQNCEEVSISDGAFMANAESNLDRGRTQIQRLRGENVPTILEPVRTYLVEWMEFYWHLEQARWVYAKTGNFEPLGKTLCQQCSCDTASDDLITKLKAGSTEPFRKRLRSAKEWYNRTQLCRVQKYKYPVAAWDEFRKQLGVNENLHHTSPE